MPAYHDERYSPPAAVARVSMRNLDSSASIDGISMLLDSGADISPLPRTVIDALALPFSDRIYEVMAYDNTVRPCPAAHAEVLDAISVLRAAPGDAGVRPKQDKVRVNYEAAARYSPHRAICSARHDSSRVSAAWSASARVD